MRKALLGISTAGALALALAACTNDATPTVGSTPVDDPATPTAAVTSTVPTADQKPTATPEPSVLGVGDTVEFENTSITLHGVRFSEGNDFSSPEEGTRWLVIDASITNHGDEPHQVSSLLDFNLIDPEHRSVDTVNTGDEQGSLDGTLAPGRTMRGETSFVVAEGDSSWELIYEPDLFGQDQAIFVIDASDAQ